jgi:outer membrane lipopolysaccharide assembly protein LptE/RlpB
MKAALLRRMRKPRNPQAKTYEEGRKANMDEKEKEREKAASLEAHTVEKEKEREKAASLEAHTVEKEKEREKAASLEAHTVEKENQLANELRARLLEQHQSPKLDIEAPLPPQPLQEPGKRPPQKTLGDEPPSRVGRVTSGSG